MQYNKNGIRIDTPAKTKQQARPKFKLETITMLYNNQRITVPKFTPVINQLKKAGYKRERANKIGY